MELLMLNNICEVLYGLYHIEKEALLGYEVTSNEGNNFCNDTTVSLSVNSDVPWLTSSKIAAEWVKLR